MHTVEQAVLKHEYDCDNIKEDLDKALSIARSLVISICELHKN
jgi:hypothetical protein